MQKSSRWVGLVISLSLCLPMSAVPPWSRKIIDFPRNGCLARVCVPDTESQQPFGRRWQGMRAKGAHGTREMPETVYWTKVLRVAELGRAAWMKENKQACGAPALALGSVFDRSSRWSQCTAECGKGGKRRRRPLLRWKASTCKNSLDL